MSNWTKKDFEKYTEEEWRAINQIKLLLDENIDNAQIIQGAHKLSLAVLGLISSDGGADSLAMSLQEYAYERLEIAKDESHDGAWAEEYGAPIDDFIAYGERKWNS